MDRWIRFSATGAHLCWRVKNGARSVPFKTLKTLADGLERVTVHESDGMLSSARPIPAARTVAGALTPIARLLADVIAHPRNRADRKRTSGRTQEPGKVAHAI